MSIFEAVVLEAEVNRLRAENEALRIELAQQAELHRMEREALIGAWNETSRQLRARIEDLENELRSVKYEANVDARYAAQCNDEAARLDRENRILRAVMRLRNPRHDR